MDERKEYLLQCITTLLKLNAIPDKLKGSPIIDDFLDNPEKKSLALVFNPTKGFKTYKPSETLQPDNLIVQMSKNSSEQ